MKNFVETIYSAYPCQEVILELGSFQVSGQEHIADLRPIFQPKSFWGIDMRKGKGVDCCADGCALPFPDRSIGTFLMLDTLEHVRDLQSIFKEAFRVLQRGGLLILSTVMNFPIHDHPSDYWRFTPEALRLLLQQFDHVWVGSMGKADFPHTVLAVALKQGSVDEINHFNGLTVILEKRFHPDPEKKPKSSDRSALAKLKRGFVNLSPSSWPEVQSYILNETFRRFQADSNQHICGVLCPKAEGIDNPFKFHPDSAEEVLFFKPGSDIGTLSDFNRPVQRLFLPLTFSYIWDTENMWDWIEKNIQDNATLCIAMPNMSFLPILMQLIEGRFSPGRYGMCGPLMDTEAWLIFFKEKGIKDIRLQWNPVASLICSNILPTETHGLSPSFVLEFNFPKRNNKMSGI